MKRTFFAAREELVRVRVFEGEIVQVDFHAAVLLDHAHGVLQYRQRCQAEEIHLQQADALQRIHVVLRGDFIPAGLV